MINLAALYGFERTPYSRGVYNGAWGYYIRASIETQQSLIHLIEQVLMANEATYHLQIRIGSLYTREWRDFVRGFVQVNYIVVACL